MTTPLNDELAEMEALLEKVTKGPWMVNRYNDSDGIDLKAIYQTTEAALKNVGDWKHPQIAEDVIRDDDANFIARSREFIPKLIAAYREMEKGVEAAKGMPFISGHCCEHCVGCGNGMNNDKWDYKTDTVTHEDDCPAMKLQSALSTLPGGSR